MIVAFSPDMRTLALGGGRGEIRLWDIASGRRIEVTPEPARWPCFVAVSPDGQTLATARGYVQLWDTATGRAIRTAPPSFPGRFVNFSPDGTTLTNGASLWNLQTGKVVHSKVQGEVASFSPDGQYLLASGQSYYRVIHVATLHELWIDHTYRNASSAADLGEKCIPAFSLDGKMVAWGCQSLPLDRVPGHMVILKETATGKEIRRIRCPDPCWAVAFCPDGHTLAVAGVNYIQLRDVDSGDLVREIEKPSPEPWRLGPWRRAMAISPDGTILAAAAENNSIGLWEITTGRELGRLRGHHGQVLSLAFTPDGRSLISGSEDTTALVWGMERFHRTLAQGSIDR
jgi:WD40 repeat protein